MQACDYTHTYIYIFAFAHTRTQGKIRTFKYLNDDIIAGHGIQPKLDIAFSDNAEVTGNPTERKKV